MSVLLWDIAVFIRILFFLQLSCLQDALRPDRSSATHFGMPAVSILELDVVSRLAVQSFQSCLCNFLLSILLCG
jgi:hypothetical protein